MGNRPLVTSVSRFNKDHMKSPKNKGKLMNKDQPNVPYVSCVALGYVRDPIPNLYKVCRNEGFPGLENNYVT